MPKHVFISYSQENGDFADILVYKIKEANFEVWIDNDRLHAGEDWRAEIDQAIKNAIALVVVMTPEAQKSEYVTYEWAFACGAGIKVIPLMFKKTILHPRLEALQYLNFINRNARPWEKFFTVLKSAASGVDFSSISPTNPSLSLHTPQRTKEQWLTTAKMFYEQGHYEEALAAFDEALRFGPDATAYSGKGKALRHLYRIDEALTAYTQAILLDGNYAPAYAGKGDILLSYHAYRADEILAAYEQAVRLDPDSAEYLSGKGKALTNNCLYDKALEVHEQAIRLDPDNAEYLIRKGSTLVDLERTDEALAVYNQALRLDPDNAEYEHFRDQALRELNRKKP